MEEAGVSDSVVTAVSEDDGTVEASVPDAAVAVGSLRAVPHAARRNSVTSAMNNAMILFFILLDLFAAIVLPSQNCKTF
jgi:hypothetical protein